MRTIEVSTEVFARIWALRTDGEACENAVLSRVLWSEEIAVAPHQAPSGGITDSRFGVTFPQGFEVFRIYRGQRYRANVDRGAWKLDGTAFELRSLNELSRRIGAKTENAWQNWLFQSPDGPKPVAVLREPASVSRRTSKGAQKRKGGHVVETELASARWVDDVAVALGKLGGRAGLAAIYEEVHRIRTAVGRSCPRTFDAIIRRELENHSSDSHNYLGGDDLFQMPEGKGAGVWALR